MFWTFIYQQVFPSLGLFFGFLGSFASTPAIRAIEWLFADVNTQLEVVNVFNGNIVYLDSITDMLPDIASKVYNIFAPLIGDLWIYFTDNFLGMLNQPFGLSVLIAGVLLGCVFGFVKFFRNLL